jgi:hypothetical protein
MAARHEQPHLAALGLRARGVAPDDRSRSRSSGVQPVRLYSNGQIPRQKKILLCNTRRMERASTEARGELSVLEGYFDWRRAKRISGLFWGAGGHCRKIIWNKSSRAAAPNFCYK